jgi:hypothetical protein
LPIHAEFVVAEMFVGRPVGLDDGPIVAHLETTKPLVFTRKINGLAILVAGTGFEPVTFGL